MQSPFKFNHFIFFLQFDEIDLSNSKEL